MGRNLKITMGIFVTLLLVGIVSAQNCRNGNCGVPSFVGTPQPAQVIEFDKYEWRDRPDMPDTIYLFKNGIQIGGWSYLENYYQAYDAARDAWGLKVLSAPYELPLSRNFGLDKSKLHKCDGGPNCTHNGRKITTQEAMDIIGDKIPDNSKKFRITVIGSKQERETVKASFDKLETDYKVKVNVWYVAPDNFALKDLSTGKTIFKTDGNPSVYFQAWDGKVLHRQAGWQGEKDLDAVRKAIKNYEGAKDFLALRKASKNYDAEKDPDLRKEQVPPTPTPLPTPVPMPQPNPLDPLKNVPTPAWVLIIVAVLAFLAKRNNWQLPNITVNK